ncbi:hypothetical protein [Streptomyces scopuliridis]|uniref:hypothetical protein n=1 Tax=Streptomyces scopuliridis TaxID=452529 RepID=UPI0036A403DC
MKFLRTVLVGLTLTLAATVIPATTAVADPNPDASVTGDFGWGAPPSDTPVVADDFGWG